MSSRPKPFSFSWGAACRRAPPFNFSNRGFLPLRFRKPFLPKAGPVIPQGRPLCISGARRLWRRGAGTRGEVGRLGADAASRRREARRAGWAGWAGWLCEVRRGTGAHQGVGTGCRAAVVRAGIAWFCVVENTSYLWHFAPEWSSFSVNGFAILFMNNHEYRIDMRKQLSDGYNMNNEHISTLKRYSNDLDTRDKRKERRTLHD